MPRRDPSPRRRAAPDASRQARLVELFEAHHTAVLGYVSRRAGSADRAADVFSEVFLTAWRRLDDVPLGDEARLWLFGVARRTLANARRAARRRGALVDRLAASLPPSAFVTLPEEPASTGRIRAAIDRLDPADAELVRLVAWEGLAPREAGAVVGLGPDLARVRLHRARARLRAWLADDDSGHRDACAPGATPVQRGRRDGHGAQQRAPARPVEKEVR
ncbi:MAG: sigma-70 family RNA polymerase sigma factor [Acidimicrobiales bacterium]|nr:sigma-70 family RNA polymerase sigma factor [Acidimicrobiales bacterium]